jgi:hypothetical protein
MEWIVLIAATLGVGMAAFFASEIMDIMEDK